MWVDSETVVRQQTLNQLVIGALTGRKFPLGVLPGAQQQPLPGVAQGTVEKQANRPYRALSASH